MNKANLRAIRETVPTFVVVFLGLDYFWYKQQSKYIKSVVWARVLDSSGGAASKPSERK